jgi:hypothetical protein
MLYGFIFLLAEETPLKFDTCNAFILVPEIECDSPPRSNTLVSEYISGQGARCSWEQAAGFRAFECSCHPEARIDSNTGDCVCNKMRYGDGRRFCYQAEAARWSEMTLMTKTPTPRMGHSMVLSKDFFWVFGGLSSEGEYVGDLHCMSTRTYLWKTHGVAAHSGGPSPRAYHAVATWQEHMFVHGGRDNATVFNDLFLLEVSTSPPSWTDFSALRNAPSPRCHHVAAVVANADETSALLYIFGGMDLDGNLLGDLHELDVSALQWRSLSSAAGSPSARRLHTLVPCPGALIAYPREHLCGCAHYATKMLVLMVRPLGRHSGFYHT